MWKKLLGRGGPLGVFVEYPLLLRLACISVCAEIAWATLLIILQYHFKDDLLRGEAKQLIASRVVAAALAFTLVETLFKVPMGALSDRYGPRRFIFFALGLSTISPILMSFATSWTYFIPLRALDGLAAAALWPSMSALMTRSVPRDARAAAMSVFNGAYCLGMAIGPMMGLFLGQHFGNRHVFPLCSVFMLVGLVIAVYVLRNGLGAQPAAEPHGVHDELVTERAMLRGRPMLVRMMGLYALSQSAVGMLYVMPLYLDYQFHIQEGDLPRLIAVPALIVAFIAIPLGRVADGIGRARAVWISYVMAAVGMFLIALTSVPFVAAQGRTIGLVILTGGMLLMVASYILGTPAWLGLTSVQVDDSQQGQALSLMQTSQGVGVNIGLGLVAFAGNKLWTRWERVKIVMHKELVEHWPKDLHFPRGLRIPPKMLPQVTKHVTVVRFGPLQSHDAVPIAVWLWASTVLFVLCLIGTLLYVREPEARPEVGPGSATVKQPVGVTGV